MKGLGKLKPPLPLASPFSFWSPSKSALDVWKLKEIFIPHDFDMIADKNVHSSRDWAGVMLWLSLMTIAAGIVTRLCLNSCATIKAFHPGRRLQVAR